MVGLAYLLHNLDEEEDGMKKSKCAEQKLELERVEFVEEGAFGSEVAGGRVEEKEGSEEGNNPLDEDVDDFLLENEVFVSLEKAKRLAEGVDSEELL